MIFHGIISQPGGSSYDADYQAVLDRATFLGYGLPTEAESIRASDAIIDAKAAGIWDLWDVFYGMIGNIDFATLNWKDPSSHQLTLVNSPSYDTTNGFLGNGTSSYLLCNWIPSSDGVNYTQNEAGVGIFSTNTLNANSNILTSLNAAGGNVGVTLIPNFAGNARYRINDSNVLVISNPDGAVGRFHVKRTTSTAVQLYKDGTQLQSTTSTSDGVSTVSLTLFCNNIDSAFSGFSARSAKTIWAGASLNGLESTVDTIIQSIYA